MRGERELSRQGILVLLLSVLLCLGGCGVKTTGEEKLKDCDFTVLEEEEVPKELNTLIEERKKEPFKLSYAEEGYLYIIQGYGKQIGGGYSISVQELYETQNEICMKTTLSGPKEEGQGSGESYPYIVVKMEYIEKEISFIS